MTSRSEPDSTRIHRKRRSFWIKLLCRPGLASRLAASRALANLGPETGLMIPSLIALLAEPELRTRKRAYLVLLRLGIEHDVLAPASRALYDEPEPADEATLQWYNRLGMEVDPNAKERERRKYRFTAVCHADLDPSECLEFFVALLADPNEAVCDLAAHVLRGPWLTTPADGLAGATSNDPNARVQAAHAAGEAGANGLPILSRLIHDREPAVRQVATVALSRLGSGAVAELAIAMEDEDATVRRQAAWALSRPLGPEAIGLLIRAMGHPLARVRKDAIKTIEALGAVAGDALPYLDQARNDPDQNVATAAGYAYPHVSHRLYGKTLRHWAEKLNDPRPSIRRNVAKILVYAPRPDLIMDALTKLVRDPDPAASRAARYAFEEGDLEVTHPAFLQLLHDPDPQHRLSALNILHYGRRAQGQAIVGQVIAMFDDPDQTVRNRVLHRLIRIDHNPLIHAYEVLPLQEGSGGAKDESDRFARARAAAALGDWGNEGLAPLREALNDPDVLVRRAAQVAIWRIGPAALDAARLAAHDDDPDVRVSAVGFIGNYDPEALDRLVPLLDDPDDWVCATAIAALARFGPRAATALPWLHNTVRGPSRPSVRQAALSALGEIDPAGPEVTRLLLSVVSDPDALIRGAAVEGLGAVNPDFPEVVPALARALADPELKVRHTAVLALGRIGPRARAALGAMIVACSDPEWIVSRYAQDNLLRLLPQDANQTEVDAVVAVLTAALHSGDWAKRFWSIEALSDLAGIDSSSNIPSLSSLHHHPSCTELTPPGPFPAAAKALATAFHHFRADVRQSVVQRFSSGREAALAVLPELTETYRTTPDDRVRHACLYAFQSLGPDAATAVPDLIATLANDPDEQVRFDTALTLTHIDPTIAAAIPALVEGLDDSSTFSRERAANALGRMGPLATSAVTALNQALGNPDEATRNAAANALKQIRATSTPNHD